MTDIHDILDAPATTFEPDDRPPAFSDEALALRFAEQHQDLDHDRLPPPSQTAPFHVSG